MSERRCFVDIDIFCLSMAMGLPENVKLIGTVPLDDGRWPPQTVRFVAEGDGLPDDCRVREGSKIPVKRPLVSPSLERVVPQLELEWR